MKSKKYYIFSVFILVLILLIFKNPFIACSKENSLFYNKVLNDFDTSSYFIAVDVKSPDYKGRTIIENNNLYQYLRKTKGFDRENYVHFLVKTLRRHKALKITGKDIIDWKFLKVSEVESVISTANRGRDNFVANYFNGTLLNFSLTETEQDAIINQLFYWEIPAKIDKLTGNLIIG